MRIEIAIPTYRRPEKLARCINSIIKNKHDNYTITVLPDYKRAYVFALLNEASQRSNADIFLGISDDTEFLDSVLHTAEYYMEHKFPDLDGVISMNWINIPNVCPGAIAFCGLKFRERFPNKHIYCPEYTSLYADKELGDYAKSIDKLFICSESGIFHYHPNHYPEAMDDTHMIGRMMVSCDIGVKKERERKGLLWGKTSERVRP